MNKWKLYYQVCVAKGPALVGFNLNLEEKMMRKSFKLLIVCIALFTGLPAFSADFYTGVVAYNKGDYATALREWVPLAQNGHPNAQNNLGVMYREGEGVRQNYDEAVKLFRLSANQGDAEAQNNLGWLYDNGWGVTQNYNEANKWYKLAAEQGDGLAQVNLGANYALGYGVERNLVRSFMWMSIASVNGQEVKGKRGIDLLLMEMTREQQKQGFALARSCIEKEFKGC